jgi:hypothetical protein
MKTTVFFASIVLFLAGIAVAAPHHSAAGQDFSKRVELEGIVKKWELANPHGVVILEIKDAKGTRSIEYETHSRNNVYRAGYRDGMVKVGDKIKIFIAPNRDGSDGGYIASFLTAKGDKVGN